MIVASNAEEKARNWGNSANQGEFQLLNTFGIDSVFSQKNEGAGTGQTAARLPLVARDCEKLAAKIQAAIEEIEKLELQLRQSAQSIPETPE